VRDVVALACAVSAGIHGALAPAHFAESVGAGVGFAAATLALGGLVVVLTVRPEGSLPLVAAATVLAGLIAGYVVAAAAGSPVLHPEPEPVEALGVATKAIEGTGLLAAAIAVRRRPSIDLIPLPLTTLVALFSALVAIAVSNGHGAHNHAGDQAATHGAP
jgi:hypothetical protein